jgi:shikimate kinase
MVGGGDRSSTLTRLRALREPAYESAAHARVDTDGRSVDDVADAVIEELRAWNG